MDSQFWQKLSAAVHHGEGQKYSRAELELFAEKWRKQENIALTDLDDEQFEYLAGFIDEYGPLCQEYARLCMPPAGQLRADGTKPLRKPPKKGYAVVKHVGQGWWRELRISVLPEFIIPPRLPWKEITAKWNETHPDDRMRLESLRREYNRYRDSVVRYGNAVILLTCPIDLLRQEALGARNMVKDCLGTEDPVYIDRMKPAIDGFSQRADLFERIVAERESR